MACHSPYFASCAHVKYCDGSCTRTVCTLCKYRYHCSSTCKSEICHPKYCYTNLCETDKTCYEVDPGRGECRCNHGGICIADKECTRKANWGDCEFYTCFENRTNCGSSGHMLAYGRQYCYKFRDHYGRFTDAGKQWILCTRKCLTNSLINIYQAAIPAGTGCDRITTQAFLKHVNCYHQCGFCNIWSTNKAALFEVYDLKDSMQLRAFAQINSVAYRCIMDAIDSLIG